MDGIVVKFIPAKKWWKRSKWALMEVYTSDNGEVEAPIGFVTDGASIPFFARKWFSPTGRYFGAAIVHDFIIVTTKDYGHANAQFELELDALKIVPWRKFLLMGSVKGWRWIRRNILRKTTIVD